MKKLLLALAFGAVMAAPATSARLSPDAELAKLIGNRVADKPTGCIDLSMARSTRIIEGRAIVYEIGSTLYVNRPGGVEHLRDDDILVTRVFGGQLCRLDTVNLVSRAGNFQHGFVVLGDFIPYRRADGAPKASPTPA
ncbi:hypothetical protein SAMN05192583_0284 [Sphingomonas gellani]|uniref:Uncharacterized protein n=1 Tax=Sphingomonas gellani TaxID=1166340 RepID=A0A1H7YLA3_9SPHN|nr:hypothetical protein [Sphingomonas gellani]SEM45909.1 hypothetical protein SAMN05192583_0284 [Sphingomonas gellani]